MNKTMTRFEMGLVALVLSVIGWSAWNPADWGVWWMEMSWVLGVFALLLATPRWFRFSTASYAIVTIWLVMHTIGAHYTFEHVPFGWVTNLFGFTRNHYDRVAHFAIGLNSFMLAELFYRKRWASTIGFAAFSGVIAIMAMACAWEIVEWAVAVWDGGADGLAFLGSQGDVWDAQEDMLADTIGALLAAVLFLALGAGAKRKAEQSNRSETRCVCSLSNAFPMAGQELQLVVPSGKQADRPSIMKSGIRVK